MNITTLPISFRPNRAFRILFTPFITNCIYRLCGGKRQIFPINARSLRDEPGIIEPNALCNEYSTELDIIGIPKQSNSSIFFTDRDPEYTNFLRTAINRGIKSGIYRYSRQKICYCSCGKIEIPIHNLCLIDDNRLKLVYRTRSGWICRFCKSYLHESVDDTLVLDLVTAPSVQIMPVFQVNKYESVRSSTNREILISRSHRSHANDVQVDDITIDPDHCWQYFLNYLHAKYDINEFTVVVGVNQIHLAAQLISLVKLTNSDIKIRIVITPLIMFDGMSSDINRRTTAKQLADILGSTIGIRVFLSLLVQWSREVSNICESDTNLIKESLRFKIIKNVVSAPFPLDCFESNFNRQNVLRLLKLIRKQSTREIESSRIIDAITN